MQIAYILHVTLIPTTICTNNIFKRNNHITSGGQNEEHRGGMGVIESTANGIVNNVTENFAQVISVTNP